MQSFWVKPAKVSGYTKHGLLLHRIGVINSQTNQGWSTYNKHKPEIGLSTFNKWRTQSIFNPSRGQRIVEGIGPLKKIEKHPIDKKTPHFSRDYAGLLYTNFCIGASKGSASLSSSCDIWGFGDWKGIGETNCSFTGNIHQTQSFTCTKHYHEFRCALYFQRSPFGHPVFST